MKIQVNKYQKYLTKIIMKIKLFNFKNQFILNLRNLVNKNRIYPSNQLYG